MVRASNMEALFFCLNYICRMKSGFIVALLICVCEMTFAQATDTLGYADFLTGTQALYDSPNGGYAFGTNGYQDQAKAQTYTNDQSFVLKKALILFGDVVFGGDSTSSIRVNVYDNSGVGITSLGMSDSIAPDSVIAFIDVPTYELLDDGSFTEVEFLDDTIVIQSRFSIGVDFTNLNVADTVGLFSTTDGDAAGTYNAWELTAAGDWFTVEESAFSWGLQVDFGIFPVIDEDDPAGIGQLERKQLSMYPNPCIDIISISNSDLRINRAKIFDSAGREVLSYSFDASTNTIDVSELESGIYIVSFQSEDSIWSGKFIKSY